MAPRRGGSSGGSSGTITIGNQCAEVDAFESDFAKGQIAIYSVFLLLFFILAIMACTKAGKRKKANQAKGILKWYHFGITISLILIFFIILVVRYVLLQCYVLYSYGYDNTALGTTLDVILILNEIFMLMLVLFVVVPGIFALAGSTLNIILKIIFGITFGLVVVMGATLLILDGLLTWKDYSYYSPIYNSSNKVIAAYNAFFLIATIAAIVGLAVGMAKLNHHHLAKKGVIGWIPVLMISLLGYALYGLIYLYLVLYDKSYKRTDASFLAGSAISYLFFWGAFLSMFYISKGSGWEHMGTTATYAEYDPTKGPIGGHPQSTTPAPPYAGTTYSGAGTTYSGAGQYDNPGAVYPSGGWNTGGYAPVQTVPTAYAAPHGAMSHGHYEQHELTGRR